ncbi:2-amino-4-hydroxy-6-hydroxymethyldihydropteridine diphosphokinase [Legionella sp. MW5194]|uniref:2-amino-4-hydroxy-6- hydroxymethyldihydropteridine diphosphokinase n=1 Tax=Legionella sp. MW5194 TaxID=2662448 RepID=UPI00193C97FB|nr:2-amino-4-hydroxy-6-hydroxymethyldihydropteridine diphosphokinase [Legionella sp. MW5194]QRN03725.1 2-amino-4-hydroxy-6-hydroxymethyldihydropteridine diphosphokinase [Legionella sp. MW5194]
MTCVYLGLGSNLGSAERQLRRALDALRTLPDTRLLQTAPFYRNQAWGRKAQPRFTNTVAAIQTRLSPQALLTHCHRIEHTQGRLRQIKWGARTLDIDILLFGSLIMDSLHLTIPHPRLLERDFACLPLLALNPHVTLPDGRLLSDALRF